MFRCTCALPLGSIANRQLLEPFRARGDSLARDKLRHEFGDLSPKQGAKIRDRRDLIRVGQQVLKMSAPPCWVLADTVFADGSPVEEAFDPATQPDSRLGLGIPNRPQHLDDQVVIHVGYQQRPEHWR